MVMRHLFASVVVASIASTSTASAHVIMENWEQYAGYKAFLTLAVPHGCGPSPTTEVRLKVPDGIAAITPEPKPGWQLTIVRKKLDQPRAAEGGVVVTEVVDEIVWSAGNLPADQLARFNFLAALPDTPGKVLYFKTIQKCAEGETRWVETVADGEPIWKTWANPLPSPFIELKQAPRPQLGATMQQIAAERKKSVKPAGGQ